jgi:hypothetical protein
LAAELIKALITSNHDSSNDLPSSAQVLTTGAPTSQSTIGGQEGNQNAAREKTTVGDTYYCPSWDATEARGIRRRIQKRAIAGDIIMIMFAFN